MITGRGGGRPLTRRRGSVHGGFGCTLPQTGSLKLEERNLGCRPSTAAECKYEGWAWFGLKSVVLGSCSEFPPSPCWIMWCGFRAQRETTSVKQRQSRGSQPFLSNGLGPARLRKHHIDARSWRKLKEARQHDSDFKPITACARLIRSSGTTSKWHQDWESDDIQEHAKLDHP